MSNTAGGAITNLTQPGRAAGPRIGVPGLQP